MATQLHVGMIMQSGITATRQQCEHSLYLCGVMRVCALFTKTAGLAGIRYLRDGNITAVVPYHLFVFCGMYPRTSVRTPRPFTAS